MTDRRKKRPTATASHYDTSSQEFHVVNISDADAAAPRRRSASAGRSESWMAKVTTAMSHRLFAGRRLSGSRSTQVMPMLQGKENISQHSSKGDESSDGRTSELAQRSRDLHTLRQVSSEAALPRSMSRAMPSECPTVVCDIESIDPPSTETRGASDVASRCSVNTIHVRTPQRPSSQSLSTQEKVYPRSGSLTWDEASESVLTQHEFQSNVRVPRGARDDAPAVQSAAPILKDFFSRNATSTHRERAQQRESRRGQHYRSSKERHDRFRVQTQHEADAQAEQTQREKIERLRKLNQQRRLQMRQEASTLKKSVAASKGSAHSRFEAEREKWEEEFEAEIDTLGKAYRRAYAHDGDSMRPVTVAGLAVPEALSQIQRDAVNHRRQLKTAAPAGWSSALESFQTLEMPELNALHIEDSNEVYEMFVDDIDKNALSRESKASTFEALLAERKAMAHRIALLEQELEKAKHSVVVEAAHTTSIEDGFFI